MTRSLLFAAALAAVAVPAAAQAPAQASGGGDTGGGVVRYRQPTTGAEVYERICQACHMADGKGGTGAGSIPALADNPKLSAAAYPIMVVTRGAGAMPGFTGMLSNAQMAEVIGYVRTHFGNAYAKPVTAADVAALAPAPPTPSH
ncbi:c-type cytochrome [Phenylobacterium sp.]|uniref:c-type cytochrome n=1 Tax=Phenylobacterium sp. TaxID=1871053 RepID=UPI00391D5E88